MRGPLFSLLFTAEAATVTTTAAVTAFTATLAGSAIAIDNLGAPFDGKYVVTSSRHVYDQTTGYTTHFAVPGRQERSLFGLASGSGSRPAARTSSAVSSASSCSASR